LNHGSRFLSYEDVTNLMDLSETEEDLDLLTDILVSICNYKYSRYGLIQKTIGLFLLLCVNKQDVKNAKKVFDAVNARWPIGNGNLRVKYYYLLYLAQNHDEIVKCFNSCKISPLDQEYSLYIGTLYKIGTPEAYDLIKNDQVSASQTYNMAKFLYALFSIDQGDFEEADVTINKRKIGKVEYVADIKHLQWYLLFKRGDIKEAIEFLEEWIMLKNNGKWQFTVPFSHQAMEEFTKAVKNMKNSDLWNRWVQICKDLENDEKASLVEASMFEIVARPNQFSNRSKANQIYGGRLKFSKDNEYM